MEDILKGAYDMHIHTSPDVSPRKSTDIEIAEEWKTAGMKGGVVKCHFADTTGRAAILSALYPDPKIYGGLVLNRQAGGINPDAVERMAQAGGKYVWFPTMDSLAYRKFHFRNDPSADLSPYLSVMGEDENFFRRFTMSSISRQSMTWSLGPDISADRKGFLSCWRRRSAA